jgi:hypothetical protein
MKCLEAENKYFPEKSSLEKQDVMTRKQQDSYFETQFLNSTFNNPFKTNFKTCYLYMHKFSTTEQKQVAFKD